MYTIEAFYFLTRIILIDDDSAFLQALSSKLSTKFLVKSFDNPSQALAYIQNAEVMQDCIRPQALVDETLEYGERYLSLSKMNQLVDNSLKQEIITVIISDYMMPEMNGVEFFQQLSTLPVMKILLTGNADLDLALYAFNRGIVDKFLLKKSEKLVEEVEKTVQACQHGFFSRQSYPILNSLNLPEDSLLRYKEFFVQLKNSIEENQIKEYYLIDNIGSYLFINDRGEKIYFINIIARQFDEYIDIARNSAAPKAIIEQLQNRTYAPVFLSEQDYKLSPQNWARIMKKFEKSDIGYYSMIRE